LLETVQVILLEEIENVLYGFDALEENRYKHPLVFALLPEKHKFL
jgi:hypothetical protein